MGERYFIVQSITDEDQPIFKGKVKNPELSDIVKFSDFNCFPTQSELEVMGSLRGSALCESALYDTWVMNVKISRGLWGAILGTFATAGLLVAGVASYAIGLIPVAGAAG